MLGIPVFKINIEHDHPHLLRDRQPRQRDFAIQYVVMSLAGGVPGHSSESVIFLNGLRGTKDNQRAWQRSRSSGSYDPIPNLNPRSPASTDRFARHRANTRYLARRAEAAEAMVFGRRWRCTGHASLHQRSLRCHARS